MRYELDRLALGEAADYLLHVVPSRVGPASHPTRSTAVPAPGGVVNVKAQVLGRPDLPSLALQGLIADGGQQVIPGQRGVRRQGRVGQLREVESGLRQSFHP